MNIMDIVPWKSFGEISRLRREMDDLPTRFEEDKTEATFDKDILTITLPKVEKVKKKQIKIKVT